MNNRGKPTIKTGGNVVKKTPLQTMEDKLRYQVQADTQNQRKF